MEMICRVVALLALSSIAWASDLAVFGYTLNTPLQIETCPPHIVGQKVFYHPFNPNTCAWPIEQDGVPFLEAGRPSRIVWFNKEDAPAIVKNSNFVPLEVDGKLIGVRFATPGADAQAAVMDMLQAKYGKPTSTSERVVENLNGASFKALSAKWNLPDLKVTFEGIDEKIDTGSVIIDTPQADQIRREYTEKVAHSGKQL